MCLALPVQGATDVHFARVLMSTHHTVEVHRDLMCYANSQWSMGPELGLGNLRPAWSRSTVAGNKHQETMSRLILKRPSKYMKNVITTWLETAFS